jgi:hypothetical protein
MQGFKDGRQLLNDILEGLGLSMRARDRIIKLARTIADLKVRLISARPILPKLYNTVIWTGRLLWIVIVKFRTYALD